MTIAHGGYTVHRAVVRLGLEYSLSPLLDLGVLAAHVNTTVTLPLSKPEARNRKPLADHVLLSRVS